MGDEFDIKFSVLPPRLQMQLWVLALDANTSRVNISHNFGSFVSGVAYNYGGNIEASFGTSRLSSTLGVNPGSGDMSAGLVFRGFTFGANASVTRPAAGLSLSYGATLLPFPAEMSTVFNSAAHGLGSMTADIAAAPNNPLAWYGLHSDDVSAIGKAVSLGQSIARAGQGSDRFGASLRINYTPQAGFVIYGGAIFLF